MGKTPKGRKKSKTKSKKSTSKTKSKLMSINLNTNNGAPEIENEPMTPIQQTNDEVKCIKLFRRAMKVKYTEVYEKQIRKAKRSLNKIKKTTDSQEEIQAAEAILQEAINDLQDASQWLHPTETINQLNNILELQIENNGNIDIIEETKNFIMDAEESEQLILKGKKEAMFFKIIEVKPVSSDTNQELELVNEEVHDVESIANEESDNENESVEDNESEANSMDENSTEDLMEIENQNELQLPTIEPHQMNIEISKNSNFITPLKSQTKISDFIQNNNEETDGDATPKRKTKEVPINVAQEQLQKALTVLSPQEKLQKIRERAKVNNELSKQKAKELSSKIVNDNNSTKQGNSSKKIKTTSILKKKKANDDISSKSVPLILVDEENIQNEEDENESQGEYVEADDEESVNISNKAKQTKISLSRNYSTYFSVKLKVEKGIATKQLSKSLKTFFEQLYEIDPEIAIYEYDSQIPSKAILNVKNLPNDYAIMKTFFNNINVKPNGGHSWFQMWIGHDEPVENLLINMKHWSTENDSYIYKKRLQEKYTAKEYWLLWSTERMDPEVLKEQIDDITMQLEKKKYQLSFNFGMIRKDPKFSNSTKPSKWNKAMIIETKREEKDAAYNVLGRIFSTTNNIKILGTEMRMIPVMSSDLPSHTKRKIARMTHKQEQFLSTLVTKPCVYLSEIDYFNTKLKTTLRDIVMNLETLKTFNTNGDPMKIFINVDYSTWHSAYVLTFPKHLEKEADDFIAQMPAYLHYVYGEEILYMLTAEGAVKANESKWDEENLCATSNLDLELDAIELESSNKSWLPQLQEDLITFDTNQIEMQGKLHDRATDADSVSTFASKTRIIENYENPNHQNHNPNHQTQIDPNENNDNLANENHDQKSSQEQHQDATQISTDDETSEFSNTDSNDEDQKARQPNGQGDMKTFKSAVSDLEGTL